MNEGSPRQAIIEVLRQHPEGLTITTISELTKLHRHTVTKYLYELRGADIIYEREVGPARLCYLKDGFTKKKEREIVKRLGNHNMRGELGQVQLLAILLFLILVPAAIITAQNATNFTQNISLPLEGYLSAVNDSPEPNQTGLIEDIVSNETLNQTNESEIEIEINVSLNITDDTTINETNETETNETIINETYAEPPNVTINETLNETEKPSHPEAVLNVEIISPERVNRGGSFEIKAFAENIGSASANNIRVEWILPEGFEILSGDGSTHCEEVSPKSSCWNNITAAVSLTSQMGKSDIKVRVSYSD